MGVFANLIPGVREVRAPLAAGGILLLALALAVQPCVPDKDSASGLIESAIAIADALGPVGRGAVVAFAAYLLGSVAQAVSSAAASRFSVDRPRTGIAGPIVEKWSPLDIFARDRAEAAIDQITAAADTGLREVFRAGHLNRLPSFEYFNGLIGLEYDRDANDLELVSEPLAADIARQGEVVQRRLLGAEPEWFGEVDRFQAEAEFREAIALPLLVLGGVCAVRASTALVGAAIFVGTAIFTLVLMVQGNRRRGRANATLADAVIVGRVKAPALETFEADVATALRRIAEAAERKRQEEGTFGPG